MHFPKFFTLQPFPEPWFSVFRRRLGNFTAAANINYHHSVSKLQGKFSVGTIFKKNCNLRRILHGIIIISMFLIMTTIKIIFIMLQWQKLKALVKDSLSTRRVFISTPRLRTDDDKAQITVRQLTKSFTTKDWHDKQ